MLSLFQYDFIVRGFIAGVVVAFIAPVIGIVLVLRRYSLIADTLAHVSLAGIALGLLFNINPLITAIVATVASSTVIEKLRASKRVYGESALALFLSGSLALAVVLIGLSNGFTAGLFNYLFGSITTVSRGDVTTVVGLAAIVLLVVWGFSKEILYVTFDEEAARVSGVNTRLVNLVFIILSAVTISLAIPIVGILLISALLVIPAITALLFKKAYLQTIAIAQVIAIFSVIAGLLSSFYFNLAPGGAIVIVLLFVFFIVEIATHS